MPVTPQQVEVYNAHQTIAELRPKLPIIPDNGFTMEQVEALLNFSEQVAKLWNGPTAVIQPSDPVTEGYAQTIIDRNAHMLEAIQRRANERIRQRLPPSVRPLQRQKAEQQLLDTFSSPANGGRPFVKLLMEPLGAKEAKTWLNNYMARALRSADQPYQVPDAPFVGWRDWNHLSSWERGQTLVAAAEFGAWIEIEKAKRRQVGKAQPVPAAYVASLSSRQARRSGVSEGELRARWA